MKQFSEQVHLFGLGNVHHPHDPTDGYYIYRGLSQASRADFLGTHWSTIPYLAYQFTREYVPEDTSNSSSGTGVLYVARIGLMELVEKEKLLTPVYNIDKETARIRLAEVGTDQEFRLRENPDRVHAVTVEELQALFWDRPAEGLFTSWVGADCEAYRCHIDWQARSRAIFESKL